MKISIPTYYASLPEGYKEIKVIDAKDSKKTAILLTIWSLILTIAALVPIYVSLGGSINGVIDAAEKSDVSPILALLVFVVSLVLYLVLHELVHGAAYKILTHQKLTFGFTLTVAFCGVPKIYTTRRTALIATTAPLLVFSAILIPIVVVLYTVNQLYYVLVGFLFAVHFGGCVGDIYVTLLLLLRYRNPKTLMNDTGPKQTFYVPQ